MREHHKKILHLMQAASVKSFDNVTSYRLLARGAPRVKVKGKSPAVEMRGFGSGLRVGTGSVSCAVSMETFGNSGEPSGTLATPGVSAD